MNKVMKNVYILQKNTKYMDGHRVTVNNRICRVCSNGFHRDLMLNQHIPDNHLCYECSYWYGKWCERADRQSIRVDGIQYRIGDEEALYATIRLQAGGLIYTECLWHQGEIPAVWIGLGLTDNAKFEG